VPDPEKENAAMSNEAELRAELERLKRENGRSLVPFRSPRSPCAAGWVPDFVDVTFIDIAD